jgi:putative multiple sugar transport system substrate-binding protein
MKKVLALVLAIVFALSLAACSSAPAPSAAPTATPAASKAPASPAAVTGKVGIAMPTKSLERWNRDGAFLQKQFESKGYKVDLVYSNNNVTQQVNDIENLIADKVNLLVIVAVDGTSLSTVLKTASDANIPVIAYDRLIMNTSAVAYYVSFDNYTVGKLQGQYVVDTLKLNVSDKSKSYNIEFTAGDPADNNAPFFFNGAFDVLKPFLDAGILKVPSGQTKFQEVSTAQWNTANAMNRMQNILASYYSKGAQLDVALCSNDSTALGVTKAISSDYAGKNKVIITGQDGDEANLANIIDGKQSMTVYKAVANEAVVTVDLGLAMLQGKKPDGTLITSSGWKFSCAYDTKTYNNNNGIVPSYLLVPTVVTKDNIQKELVDTGYYTMANGYPKAVG